MPLTLFADDRVQAAKLEDWGQNKWSGWWACVVDMGHGPTVAMRPPNGKLWRIEIPEDAGEEE